ncbi:MAG: aldehyde dehydrogenase family protein [Candidatus Promineifilaceae bacterium]
MPSRRAAKRLPRSSRWRTASRSRPRARTWTCRCTWARHVAGYVIEPEVLRDDEDSRIELHRRPVGVVAAIVPWNFPFFQTIYKLAPALLAGNTVVIKPAPTTPLNASLIAEIGAASWSRRGLSTSSVTPAKRDQQPAAHPDIAKVSFTGSTAAGRKVMEKAVRPV